MTKPKLVSVVVALVDAALVTLKSLTTVRILKNPPPLLSLSLSLSPVWMSFSAVPPPDRVRRRLPRRQRLGQVRIDGRDLFGVSRLVRRRSSLRHQTPSLRWLHYLTKHHRSTPTTKACSSRPPLRRRVPPRPQKTPRSSRCHVTARPPSTTSMATARPRRRPSPDLRHLPASKVPKTPESNMAPRTRIPMAIYQRGCR